MGAASLGRFQPLLHSSALTCMPVQSASCYVVAFAAIGGRGCPLTQLLVTRELCPDVLTLCVLTGNLQELLEQSLEPLQYTLMSFPALIYDCH
jgi:hypothetical protein